MTKKPMIFTLHANPSTTSARGRAEDRTDTLDNLRAWLIDQAQRYDWNMEDLQDLADSIEDSTAPPATPDEVVTIAAKVWDEHPRHVFLIDGDPLGDLMELAAIRRDLQDQIDSVRHTLEKSAHRARQVGFSAYRIAQITGVTHTTVARWLDAPAQGEQNCPDALKEDD